LEVAVVLLELQKHMRHGLQPWEGMLVVLLLPPSHMYTLAHWMTNSSCPKPVSFL
jgi:hypothetical protein